MTGDRKRRSSPVDEHVGARIRLRRKEIGFSQSQLGEVVSLSYQQIQKYERGIDRVGASTLLRLSEALEVSPEFFFENCPGSGLSIRASSPQDPAKPAVPRAVSSPEEQVLCEIFTRITDARARGDLIEIAKLFARRWG